MEYSKPKVVCLPDAVTSILANPLMKQPFSSDGAGSEQITVAAYSSDE
jgi:hypothetical protein